MIIYCLWIPAH